jgi:hypothetical protein
LVSVSPRRLSLLAVLVSTTALLALALMPSTASAVSNCEPWDGATDFPAVSGFEYTDDGYTAPDGGLAGAVEDAEHAPSSRSDAYDLYGELFLSTDGTNFTRFPASDPASCTREDGDREIVYPTKSVAGLDVMRKLYIPNTGDIPFARFLDILQNPSGSPVTVTRRVCGDVGSDANTTIVQTSSGDTTLGTNDRWATSWDTFLTTGNESGDPQVGHNWDANVDGDLDRADVVQLFDRPDTGDPHEGGADDFCFTYSNITVQPGQTVTYMFVGVLATTRAQANDRASIIGLQQGDVFAGLSSEECLKLQNWLCGDRNPPPPPPPAAAAPPALKAGACANPRDGTNASETLNGTGFGDLIRGLAGDDVVNGLQGDDCLDGGLGKDTLSGAEGNDLLIGGAGNDNATGGVGRDRFTGGSGNDKLTGSSGADTLSGGSGRDTLSGGLANDRLSGGAGNDRISGGAGRNRYSGGSGNDSINAANGKKETVSCGRGRNDKARADRSDRVRGCETVLRLGRR